MVSAYPSSRASTTGNPQLAALCPGQGTQRVGMADVLSKLTPTIFEEASDALCTDVLELCTDPERLATTRWAQPAIVTVAIAGATALTTLESEPLERVGIHKPPGAGFKFSAVAGHSIGEYAALAIAGSLTTAEAVQLAYTRGDAMQLCAETNHGTMAAISGIEDAKDFCADNNVVLAGHNEPGQFTVAGTHDAINAAVGTARDQGARAGKLKVAGAFHSPAMNDAQRTLKEALEATPISTPTIDFWSTTLATRLTEPSQIREALVKQLVAPVLFVQTVSAMHASGITQFVDAGPGRVVSAFAQKIAPAAQVSTLDQCLKQTVNA